MTENESAIEADIAVISARRFVGNTASVGLSTGSKAVAYFVVALVLTRVIGTAALGVFTVALSSALLALRVAELGVGAILVRDTARNPNRGAQLLGSGFAIRLPGLVLMAATIAIITELVGYGGSERALMWLLGGYVALESLSRLFFSNAHGRLRMEEEAWITVPSSLFIAVGSIGVLLANGRLVAVGIVFVAGAMLQFLGALFIISRRVPGWHRAATWYTIREILRQSWPIGLAGLAAVVYYRIDTLMLAALVGNVSTGEYSMAYNLLYGPNLLIWALMASVFPILSGGGIEEHPLLQRHYGRLTIAAVATGAAFLLIIPIASIVLLVLYDTAPQSAALSLQILLVAQLFTFVSAATSTTFNATDAQRTNLAIVLTGVALNVALNAFVIPRYAAPGAAATTLVTETFVAAAGVVILFRRGLRPFFISSRSHGTAREPEPSAQPSSDPVPTTTPVTDSNPDAIVITSYPLDPAGPVTGPQRVIRGLVEGLHGLGRPVEVWSSPYRPPPRDRRTLKDRGIVVRFVNPFAIVRKALRHPEAALHIGSFSMFHIAPMIARRVLGWIRPIGPIVYTAHGLLAVESQLGYRVVPLLTPVAERLLLGWSDRVVVLSTQMAEMLQARYGIDSTSIDVIEPAVPQEFADASGTDLRVQQPAPIFVYAGELRRVKGLNVLADAMQHLDRSHADQPWSVVVAGDPQPTWERPPGWDHLLDAGRLRHIGFVSTRDLHELYASSVALLLPSTYEPYGMVVLEAMGTGTPAIVSDQVGARDMIDDGATGWVVPSGDSGALSGAMAWVLDNPDRIAAMHATVSDNAATRTSSGVASRYLELYRKQS